MKTQIYATFGPACGQKDILKQMIEAGMTGMRLNLSHTTLPASRDYIEAYRSAAAEAGVKPQILIDMQGPELRVGDMEVSVELIAGTIVKLGEIGIRSEADIIPVPKEVIEAVAADDGMLLDDGKIKLLITEVYDGQALATVVRGGILQGHKSIKIENKNIAMPVLTAHDVENIRLAKEYGVTVLMQPFVLQGEDLAYVRKTVKDCGAEDVQIFAKIENRQGVANLDSILPETDMIIIARGDLGNDMPLWELPAVQKKIEAACHKAGKQYIVVTQMLASMEQNPVPTRAEVSDIFHAVYHGAAGVMITGESAVGRYPVEAVKYLARTAEEAERMRGE